MVSFCHRSDLTIYQKAAFSAYFISFIISCLWLYIKIFYLMEGVMLSACSPTSCFDDLACLLTNALKTNHNFHLFRLKLLDHLMALSKPLLKYCLLFCWVILTNSIS